MKEEKESEREMFQELKPSTLGLEPPTLANLIPGCELEACLMIDERASIRDMSKELNCSCLQPSIPANFISGCELEACPMKEEREERVNEHEKKPSTLGLQPPTPANLIPGCELEACLMKEERENEQEKKPSTLGLQPPSPENLIAGCELEACLTKEERENEQERKPSTLGLQLQIPANSIPSCELEACPMKEERENKQEKKRSTLGLELPTSVNLLISACELELEACLMKEERENEQETKPSTLGLQPPTPANLISGCELEACLMKEERENELEKNPSTLGLQPPTPANLIPGCELESCLVGNWADIPPELLKKIASRVFETDRFSLVCTSWNDAVASTNSTNSVPLCLMNYCRRTKTWRFHRQDSSFFVSFPQLKDAEIRCSKYGWLLMSRSDNTLFFFNPSSNQTIKLRPKIGSFSILFFIHPPTSPHCIVVGIQTPLFFQGVGICILKRGGHEWETKKYPTDTTFLLSHGPPVWHRGHVLFLDVKGNVARFDIINQRLVTSEKCLGQQDDEIDEHYLFKLKGEVFGAFVFHGEGKVKVFRLLTRTRNRKKMIKMTWELVEDIGENVVYLSHESSLSFECTADHTKNMANRIYFPKFHGDSAVFYSLSDAKYHSLNGVYSNDKDIGLLSLEMAAWVMPAAPLCPSDFTTQNS